MVIMTREQVLISVGEDLQHPYFMIPIHPRLLEPNVRLDERLAVDVFPEAARQWHEDLRAYHEEMDEGEARDWVQRFSMGGLGLGEHYGMHTVVNGWWESGVETDERGFATSLSLNRNHGGHYIIILKEEPNQKLICHLDP